MTRLPSDRRIRIAAALIIAAGLGACAVAIFSDQLGVGTEGTGRGLGWKQIALLVAGLFAAAVAGTAFARPQIVSRLISWWGKAEPEDRRIRTAGLVVLLAGLGTEGSGERFGSKQISLLVAGAIALAVGILLLGRPQVVSSRLNWPALRGSLRDASPARKVLLALIAIAIVINVIQFKTINDGRASNYRALSSYDTDDLFEIAISSSPSAQVRVAPFHYLGELFPKSIIVVPDGSVYTYYPFESSAIAFGEATSVKEASYDPENFLNLAELKQYRIDTATFAPADESTIDAIDERVSFYVDGVPSGIVLVLTPEGSPGRYGPIVFVDSSVLDAEGVPIPR